MIANSIKALACIDFKAKNIRSGCFSKAKLIELKVNSYRKIFQRLVVSTLKILELIDF